MRQFAGPSAIRYLAVLTLSLLAPSMSLSAQAVRAVDSPRADWLQRELYAYNHVWAEQAPRELATKMDKMRVDPFAFLRGTAHLFYRDMARLPAPQTLAQEVLLNGDAHLANFGCSADADGNAVFALNDFDEAAPGPAAWDLRRLASSLVLVGRVNKLDADAQASAVDAMVEGYLTRLQAFAAGEAPRRFRLVRTNTQGEVRECIEAAEGRKRAKWLDKYTQDGKGPRHFKETDELLAPDAKTREAVLRGFADYAKASGQGAASLAAKDLRQKLGSGVGSLGRLRYWVLVEGQAAGEDDDLILELKQAVASSLRPSAQPGAEGGRVLAAMRAQLAAPDPLAGVAKLGGVEYLVREKSPQQEDLRLSKLDSGKKLNQAAAQAGAALAQAHALGSPARVATLAATRVGAAQEELRAFALDYATQVESDWRSFRAAKPESFY